MLECHLQLFLLKSLNLGLLLLDYCHVDAFMFQHAHLFLIRALVSLQVILQALDCLVVHALYSNLGVVIVLVVV